MKEQLLIAWRLYLLERIKICWEKKHASNNESGLCVRDLKKTSREEKEVKVYKRDRALFLDNGAFVIQRQS